MTLPMRTYRGGGAGPEDIALGSLSKVSLSTFGNSLLNPDCHLARGSHTDSCTLPNTGEILLRTASRAGPPLPRKADLATGYMAEC